MGKLPDSIVNRDKEFYHWLTNHVDERTAVELYTVIPLLNEYGRQRSCFKESLFELADNVTVQRFRSLIAADKRYRFMHYGQIKRIMLLIEKYSCFIEEKDKGSKGSVPEGARSEKADTMSSIKDEPKGQERTDDPQATEAESLGEDSQIVMKRVITLRTVSGEAYYGETPAEALASYCDTLAEKHPAIIEKLIGQQYYGHGSVVLLPEEPNQGGIKLYNVNCYIDISIGNDAAVNYGKWICKMCFETDMPEYISVSEKKKVAKRETGKVEPEVPVASKQFPGEAKAVASGEPGFEGKESSEKDHVATKEVPDDNPSLENGSSQKESSEVKSQEKTGSSRVWSKYEVALLIETYLKTAENGYLRAAAEVLSHTLRDLARKQGKSIDSTYRNVNGIVMQLGTVQYCFTNGKKGLSNASVQIREMVDMYKNHREEFDKLLQEAHQMLGESGDEITELLQLEEYSVLREELLRQGITTVSQLKALDLWTFMNRYGLYSIRKRQEIYNNVRALLNSLERNSIESKKIYIRTKMGHRYYGSTPAEAFASFCEKLALEYPLMIRKAIGQRYNGVGMIVLWPSVIPGGSVKVSNLNAYIDSHLTDKMAILYGTWLCGRFGEKDEPVELRVNVEQKSVPSVVRAQAEMHTPEMEKGINQQESPKVKEHGDTEKEVQHLDVEEQVTLIGDAWLLKMLTEKKIQFEDKRENQGCLWIAGGHELDAFVDLCKGKGYRFHYKPDGYKAFTKGPAWWTTDSIASDKVTEVRPSSPVASVSEKKMDGIWKIEGDQLQFMNFHFTVPERFELYKDKCSENAVSFYPSRASSYATLTIKRIDQSIHDKNDVRKMLRDKVSYYLANTPYAKEEFSKIDETNTLLAALSMISYKGDAGRIRVYKGYLYHKFKEELCSLRITVDGNDDRVLDYDEVFKKLVESALKWKRVKQSAESPDSNDQKSSPASDSTASVKGKKIWSFKDGQLQFMSFSIQIPIVFDVLYKEVCTDEIVAFYPKRVDSYATLQFRSLDDTYEKVGIVKYTVTKEQVKNGFSGMVANVMKPLNYAKEISSDTKETSSLIVHSCKISFLDRKGKAFVYCCLLFNKINKDTCSMLINVDGNDEGYYNYDNAFSELIQSIVYGSVSQPAGSQHIADVANPVKQVSSDSTFAFRRWLEQDFRTYMVRVKGLSAKTVSQYCQSIEAVEQFISKRNLSMTLVNVGAEEAQIVFDKLTSRSDFRDWNKKAHHQYSAALAQYIGFLTHYHSDGLTAGESKHGESVQGALTLRDVVVNVLRKVNRSMTVGEIYAEIVLKHLYTFNSSNPRMIVDHAIRRSCEGVRLGDHTKEDVFGVVTDENGQARYYLLEWGKAEQECASMPPLGNESSNQTVKEEQSQVVEDQPSQAMEEWQPEEAEPVAESSNPAPILSYKHKQAEQIVLESDLDGITVEELADRLDTTVTGTRKIVNEDYAIIDICGKLIHKSAFVDWDLAADQLEKILDKLMDKNNGYVSKAQLYEYARADMQMFMNDNDMDNEQKIYDMAVHLFSKEKYHGIVYVFSNLQHISRSDTGMSSVLDVIKTFAREQGGFFSEDDLISYLESVKIKTGNLRIGIMHVYDKPTFLFYAYHVLVLSECLGINDKWLSDVKAALDRLFADMGDHVVLRDIQPFWYAQLPALPGDRPWTGILLQSVLLHYGKKLGRAKTIYAYQSLSGDYLQSMLVSADSEVQTFNDAVIAVLVDNQIEQREFESEELRQIIVKRGLIENADLTGKLSKYIESDERFVWSNNGQRVSIRL